MKFDTEQYKVYTWKHWAMLHWIINPGLIINELILGQRVPKVSLEDKTSDLPRIERSRVPCPHCNTIHDGRTWSHQNRTAFKNWWGLYCPSCHEVIPCLMNIWSFLFLAITYPIWGWFKKSMKQQWLRQQPQRYQDIQLENISHPFEGKKWWAPGLAWGVIMFFLMSFVFPWFNGEEITTKSIILGAVIWTLGGIGFGYSMKRILMAKGSKSTRTENEI